MTSGTTHAAPDRAAALHRCLALAAQHGQAEAEPMLAAWDAAHAEPATRAAARSAAPAMVRALRRRAWLVSAPPEAPALRARAAQFAERVRRECELPALRAELRLEELLARLDAGEAVPAAELHEQVAPALAAADAALPGPDGATHPLEDLPAAARLLSAVLSALFHRTLHNDDLDSPLAAGPDAFLRPLRASAAYRLLTTPAAPPRSQAEPVPARRVLLVTGENRNFVADLAAAVEGSGAELRTLDLTAPPEGLAVSSVQQVLAERLARAVGRPQAVPGTGPAAGSPAAQLLDWAELVVVDWAMDAAVWASVHTPPTARLAVRLHRIEAFSVQAHAVDYGRVDDLVVVAEHVVALARRALPVPPDQRVHVVPVVPRFERYATAKRPGAARTLALVGWNVPVKDVGWALDVVEGLRSADPAWRLLLVGGGLGDKLTARSWTYKAATERRIAAAEAAGAVQRLGFRDDVPELLSDVGVILTSSKVEGCHVGFFEGAASAAFPVARDWPWVRTFGGGARSVMPAEWVVADPAAAVERILAADAAGRLTAEGLEAARYVRQRYGDTGARLVEALGLA